ncbi:hypothetical protein FQA47_023631 [Oryzias melastigma]|uniref:Uncharacterized protein n=1 Tax=Oryzias melastigma TaxID=30732 RepID=A0A834FPB8_ORYME|nr:hypothetical protein FQA47_023631 [Oryzias melastigma]
MVETVRSEIKQINEKVSLSEKRVERSEESTQKCTNRVAELNSSGRRWNLRLYGLPESERENVREKVINICQGVLPAEKGKLPDAIDVAHRMRRKRSRMSDREELSSGLSPGA